MLYRMYTRWAESKGYKTEVLDFLDDFNLQECRIDDLNRTDYSFNQKIDWDEISSIINRKKQGSLKYIRSIVNQDK